MNDSISHNEDEIAQQAIEWCMRLQERDCSEQELQNFKKWHDSNPVHARHYKEALQIWDLSGQVSPVYAPPLIRSSHSISKDEHIRSWMYLLINSIPLGFRRMTVLVLAVPFVFAIGWFLNFVPNHYEQYAATESTKQIVLKDGSHVQLNLNTQLRYNHYRKQRYVSFLNGEAYFHVAHDKQKPFLVAAGAVLVTVTGTEFNVWKYNDNVVVTVIDGSVNVARDDDVKYSLSRSMQATYKPGNSTIDINAAAAVEKIMAWREGRLILDDLPLVDAINKINPYLQKPLVITDESVAQLRIGGIYDIANIKELPNLLPNILPVRLQARPDGSLLIAKK